MLTRLNASRFDRRASNGRTRPVFAAGVASDGSEIEVILKCSAGCDRGVQGLACELLAACVAADLGLPVPEPFLVDVSPEWIAIVPDHEIRALLQTSSPVAFGSRRVAAGFSTWSTGTRLTQNASTKAASILAFDAFMQNVDRRSDNPNLLVRGDELRMIDHELAFSHRLAIGWKPPWQLGGLQAVCAPSAHVLADTVRQSLPHWPTIAGRYQGIADDRLDAYRDAIPPEWVDARSLIDDACQLIAGVRDRITDCITELLRAL